jgi:hypothetical protein
MEVREPSPWLFGAALGSAMVCGRHSFILSPISSFILRSASAFPMTNAFSKKFENFKAAIALNFAYYNFVKTHGAIRMTPAQAAGVEQSAWTVAELVERCGE